MALMRFENEVFTACLPFYFFNLNLLPMTSFCFNSLDTDMQLDLVMNYGINLTYSRKFNLNVFLFQFSDFYVEVFSKLEDDELTMIRAFEDTDSLDPYLKTIDISALVS